MTDIKNTLADKWLNILWPVLLKETAKKQIQGLNVGHDHFEFKDEGQTVIIKIITK